MDIYNDLNMEQPQDDNAIGYQSIPTPKRFQSIDLLSSFRPLELGIMDRQAENVQRKVVDSAFTSMVNRGITTAEFSQEIDNMKKEAEQKATSAKSEADKQQLEFSESEKWFDGVKSINKKIQNRQLEALKYEVDNVDNTPYFNAMNQMTGMMRNAPAPPTPQAFELNETDQALVTLAGLIGGIEAMPQALQGVVAGATQRVNDYNQRMQMEYQNQQEAYNKQLSAQQNVVQTLAQKLQADERNAQREYQTKMNLIESLNKADASERDNIVKDARTRLYEIKDAYIKRWNDDKTTPYTKEDIVQMEQFRRDLVSSGIVQTQAELDMFPVYNESSPPKGAVKANLAQSQTDLNKLKGESIVNAIKISQDKNTRDKLATLDRFYDSLLVTWQTKGGLSQAQATMMNNAVAGFASGLGLEGFNYPKFSAGDTRETWKNKLDNQLGENRLALQRDALKQRIAYQNTLNDLKAKWQAVKTKWQESQSEKKTGTKVPAPVLTLIAQTRGQVAILTNKVKNNPNDVELQNKLSDMQAALLAVETWKDEAMQEGYTVTEDSYGNVVDVTPNPAQVPSTETDGLGFTPGQIGGNFFGFGGGVPAPNPTPAPQPTQKPVMGTPTVTQAEIEAIKARAKAKQAQQPAKQTPILGNPSKPSSALDELMKPSAKATASPPPAKKETPSKPTVQKGQTSKGYKWKAK
jgi:hypothetical protein